MKIAATELTYLERYDVIANHAVELCRDGSKARPRKRVVQKAIDEMRFKHRELRSRPDFAAMRAVFEREGIILIIARTSTLGSTMVVMGRAGIILQDGLAGDRLIETGLHELAHVYLHVFDAKAMARRARELQCTPPRFETYDRFEAEADWFAELILAGDVQTEEAV